MLPDYGFGVAVSQTGLHTAPLSLQVVANNLANAATPGFEASLPPSLTAQAVPHLAGAWAGSGQDLPQNESIVAGQFMAAPIRTVEQETVEESNTGTNMALTVPGYCSMRTVSGVKFTRDGTVPISASGPIVTAQGDPLVGLNMLPITPGTGCTVENGAVYGATGKMVERLGIAQFSNPSGLQSAGGSLLAATSQSGVATYGALADDVMAEYFERYNTNMATAI